MTTPLSGRSIGARGRRQRGTHEAQDAHGPDGWDNDHEATIQQLTQNQMLVNQALIEKIFALEEAQDALRTSERKLHDLIAHQLATREDERKRISRELHDCFAQNLLALRIDIVMLHQHTTKRHYRLRDRIGSALDNVDITLRSVKELLGELRPSGIDLGLMAAVDMELRKFTRASGIASDLHSGPGIADLVMDEEQLLTVYRVLQECLNNVCRHSLASRVNVHLDLAMDVLTINIADNGIGFDPAAPCKPGGFGLLDLHERVAGQGGELIVTSARTRGTGVTVNIPIPPPRPERPERPSCVQSDRMTL